MTVLKSFASLMGSKVFQKIVGFGSLIIYATLFDTEQIGFIALYGVYAELILVISTFGLQPYILKIVPQSKEQKKQVEIILDFCSLTIFIGAVMSSFVIYYYDFLGLSIPSHIIFSLGMLVQAYYAIASQIAVSLQKYKNISLIGVSGSIQLLILMTALGIYLSTDGIVIALAVNSWLLAVYQIMFLPRNRRINISIKERVEKIKSILKESSVYYIDSMLMYLKRQGDQLLVKELIGMDSLGLYYLAKRFSENVFIVTSSMDQIVTPKLSKYFAQNRFKFELHVKTISTLIVSIAIITFIIFYSFIDIYALVIDKTDEYFKYLVTILLMRPSIDIVRNVFVGRLVFLAAPARFRLYMTALETFCLFLSIYLVYPLWGLLGVAASPAIASVFTLLYGLGIIKKFIKINFQITDIIKSIVIWSALLSMYMYMSYFMVDFKIQYIWDIFFSSLLICLGVLMDGTKKKVGSFINIKS